MPRTPVEDRTNVKDQPLGWVAPDEHLKLWNENGEFTIESPLHKAWSRMLMRGLDVGPPLGEEVELEEWRGHHSVLRQRFALAVGYSLDDANQTTEFYDARGLIETESGL